MGTYRQPSLVLDKSFGQINEAMAEFNKNLIAKINADKKQALANEKAKNKLLREQEKQNARYRDYGRDIEKKLSVLKPYFEDDAISVNTGVGAVQKSVQEFEADLLAFQNGKSSADLGYGDNFDLQAYYDNILDGSLDDETGGASFELKTESGSFLALSNSSSAYNSLFAKYSNASSELGSSKPRVFNISFSSLLG